MVGIAVGFAGQLPGRVGRHGPGQPGLHPGQRVIAAQHRGRRREDDAAAALARRFKSLEQPAYIVVEILARVLNREADVSTRRQVEQRGLGVEERRQSARRSHVEDDGIGGDPLARDLVHGQHGPAASRQVRNQIAPDETVGAGDHGPCTHDASGILNGLARFPAA